VGPVGRPGRAGRHGSLSRDLLDLAQRRVVTKSSAEACEHSVEALRAGADLAADGPWQGRREVASLNARHRPPESLEPRARSPAEEPRSRHAQDGDPEPQSSEDRHVTAGRRDRHGGRRTGQQEPTRRTDGSEPPGQSCPPTPVRRPSTSGGTETTDPPTSSTTKTRFRSVKLWRSRRTGLSTAVRFPATATAEAAPVRLSSRVPRCRSTSAPRRAARARAASSARPRACAR